MQVPALGLIRGTGNTEMATRRDKLSLWGKNEIICDDLSNHTMFLGHQMSKMWPTSPPQTNHFSTPTESVHTKFELDCMNTFFQIMVGIDQLQSFWVH